MPGSATRVIDTHTHFVPPSVIKPALAEARWNGIDFKRMPKGDFASIVNGRSDEVPWVEPYQTFEERIPTMDELGIDIQTLSISPTLYVYGLDQKNARAFARLSNDELAGIVASHPDRFNGLGHLPLQDPAGAVAELEHCVRDLGLRGVMVGTNVDGVDWDSETLFPVLQAAEELGTAVFFHPAMRRADSWLKRYHLKNVLGNPLETAVALSSLIFGGVFDRLPRLKTCFVHAGGYGVLGVGRMNHAFKVRADAKGMQSLPSDYVKNCYFDCLTHSERTLRYIIDTVGADRVVLGSDYPADMGEDSPAAFVNACTTLSAAEKTAILGVNAIALLGLDQAASAERRAGASVR